MLKYTTDDEFRLLVYPCTEQESIALEENIFDVGCKRPISVWNNIIVDGVKRYEICKKWDIPFTVTHLRFDNRAGVIGYICKKQLQRDDLPDEMRRYLIGKYYEAEKEFYYADAEENAKNPGIQYHVAGIIGREVHLVAGTVYKYGFYAKALDNIAGKSRDLTLKILSGELRISHENIIELSRMPKEEIRFLSNSLLSDKGKRVNYSKIKSEVHWQRLPSAPIRKKTPEVVMPIKEIPKYDPDAEISSLSLTVPSWVSSIERTLNMANFPKTTIPARERLLTELGRLTATIEKIQSILKEDYHG